MKKLFSIILAIITLFSVTTFTTGAADVEVADTGEYYISEKPFEEVAEVDGLKVIGYLGDLDADKEITIMDATQVQLHLAQLVELDESQSFAADTDKNGEISILDVTNIQLFLAGIITEF